MSLRSNGSYIGPRPTGPTNGIAGVASGVWDLRSAQRQRSAGAWPFPFSSPTQITGLQLWLDASDASTLYDATTGGSPVAADGTVKRWEDKSGNDRHATEASNGPARKAAEQNGLDALLFDGVNDALQVQYNIAGLNGMTMFIAAKNAGTLSGTVMLAGNYGPTGGTDGLQIYLGLGDYSVSFGGRPTSSGNAYTLANSGSESLDFKVATGVISNGSISARTNGGQAGTASVSAGNIVGESFIDISHESPYSIFYNALIGEIIIYNSALSDTDREAVENYLMAKWGIT